MFNGAKPGFGQTSTTPSYGYNNTTTSSLFGQTTFGKPATPGFGQTPAFGQQNTSLFGAPPNAAAPQTTGLFGSNASTSFGQPATTQSGFGSFGAAVQPTQSLFGAQQPAQQTPLFGQAAAPSAFGAAKPAGFGGFSQPTSSLFGQSGQVNAQPGNTVAGVGGTGFGAFNQSATSGGLFGQNTSAFGQTQPTGTNLGTSIAKFQPSPGTDSLLKNGTTTNISTKLYCVTAMKEYETKSLEELRMDDYLANRKGAQAGGSLFGMQSSAQPTGGSMFGNPPTSQATTGMFGQQQENKSIFGNPTMNNSSFGQTTTFGATQQPQQANSLFGKPFAATAPTTNSFTGFGQANTTGGNLFGQPAQKSFGQTNSLFGQQPATSTATFGQTTTPGFGSTFGQPAQQQTSLFGTPATGADKPAFGMASTANTFGFNTNTNNTSGGLFGQKPAATSFGTAPAFGAATTGANTSGGFTSFGQPAASTSLFGNSFNKPAQPTFSGFGTNTSTPSMGLGQQGGMFGNTANKPGGLFGTSVFNNSTFPNTSTMGGGLGAPLLGAGAQNNGLGQSQPNNSIHQQIIVATSPYGENPLFKNFKSPSESNEEALKPTNPTAQKAILESASNHFKVSAKGAANGVRVKPIASMQSSKKSLFEGLEEDDPSVEVSFNTKPSAKRLIIKPKPGSNSQRGSLSRSVTEITSENNNSAVADESFNQKIPTSQDQMVANTEADTSRRVSWLRSNPLNKLKENNKDVNYITSLDNTMKELISEPIKHRQLSTIADSNDNSLNETAFLQTSGYERSVEEESGSGSPTEDANSSPHPTGIVLKRHGYFTIPTLDLLTKYVKDDGTCIVPNLTIGRYGYGNIYYDEPLDVANVNIDDNVFFRHRQVTVYPDDEHKPPVGKALNRSAQITLDQVWPFDKTKNEQIKDEQRLIKMKYEEKLRRVCERHETTFIEYRPLTGSWVFRVNHFSRYGLSDSDDDDEEVPATKSDPKKAKLNLLEKNKRLKETEMAAKNKLTPIAKKAAGVTAASTPILNLDQSAMGKNTSAISDADSFYQGQHQLHKSLSTQKSPRHGTAQSPSAANAMDVGVDPHKLQLMKASFFAIDFDDDSMDLDRPPSPDQIVPSCRVTDSTAARNLAKASTLSALSQFSSSCFDMNEASTITAAPGKKPVQESYALAKAKKQQAPPKFILKPKIAPIRIPRIYLPAGDSVVSNIKSKCVSDAAFFQGRRFKIGFGQQNTFFLLNTVSCHNEEIAGDRDWREMFAGRGVGDTSDSLLSHIQMKSVEAIKNFDESIVKHLLIQLKATEKVQETTGSCPHLKCNSDNVQSTLAEHRKLADAQTRLGTSQQYASNVWALCEALWGDHFIVRPDDPQSHANVMGRKTLVSEWLEQSVSAKDQPNSIQAKANTSYMDQLMKMIYSHKVVDACEFAISNADVNLAMLLSQASSGPVVRQLIQNQLVSWEEVEADKFIHRQRLKVLMLVAGVSLLPHTSNGPVNVFEKIDWLESLACCLWYLCMPTASITDVLLEYEKAFQSDELEAASPLPPYLSEYRLVNQKQVHDLRFHLLKLFSERSYPLEALFNPICHTSDPMDFRLSWFILQILEALGYHHLAAFRECQLHLSFANQLETHGLWQWAVFVLMHIKEANQREIAVQNILYKYIELSGEDSSEYLARERFIIDELGVPERWIYWAKAVRAGASKDYKQQTDYLLKAKQWNEAHRVIMQFLAPEAVINGNIEYLVGLLERLEDPRMISNWANQGQLLLDFVEINNKFESFKNLHESDIAMQWDGLKPQLAEICSRINSFPCPTAKHRLCQSEMSQRLACLVRGFLVMQASDINSCHLIRMTLERLPLPQEYQQALRSHIDIAATDMVLPTKQLHGIAITD